MKRRGALMVWAVVSPMAWIVMLFISVGYKIQYRNKKIK